MPLYGGVFAARTTRVSGRGWLVPLAWLTVIVVPWGAGRCISGRSGHGPGYDARARNYGQGIIRHCSVCCCVVRGRNTCPNPDRQGARRRTSGRGVLKPRTDCDGLTAERGACCAPTRIGLLGIGGRRHQQCEDAEENRARTCSWPKAFGGGEGSPQRLSKRQRPAVVSESTSAVGLKCVPSRNPRHLASVAVVEIGHFLLKSARLFT